MASISSSHESATGVFDFGLVVVVAVVPCGRWRSFIGLFSPMESLLREDWSSEAAEGETGIVGERNGVVELVVVL